MIIIKPKSSFRRATEFGLIGGGVSIFSFVQLWFYIGQFHMWYWTAYILQTVVSIELNYWGNYWLAWNDRRQTISITRSHLTFWGTRIVMVFINIILFATLTAFGMNYLLAQLLIIGSNTVINYFIADKLVFKNLNTTQEATNA